VQLEFSCFAGILNKIFYSNFGLVGRKNFTQEFLNMIFTILLLLFFVRSKENVIYFIFSLDIIQKHLYCVFYKRISFCLATLQISYTGIYEQGFSFFFGNWANIFYSNFLTEFINILCSVDRTKILQRNSWTGFLSSFFVLSEE
jgi:hypothetical protein